MDKIRTGFLGYGVRALDALMEHPQFDVRYFLTPGSRLCQEVYEAQERYQDLLNMEIVNDNAQLAARFAEISDVDCFVMNACPIILDREVLAQMKVFNIHPGDLRYNRGHQPHCWTVLLGERQTKIVMHSVGEGIDQGGIVGSVDIAVSPEDSAGDVLDHAEDEIPVLLDALYRHLAEGIPYESVIEEGGYRRIMEYGDYELHLDMDTREQIKRKILSRSLNHGAFFYYKGERVYVDRLVSYQEYKERENSAITVQIRETEGSVYIHSLWRSMVFRLNPSKALLRKERTGDGLL